MYPRFATLGLKVALVHTLSKMKLTRFLIPPLNFILLILFRCEKTVDKMEVDPSSIAGAFKGGVWFRPEIVD